MNSLHIIPCFCHFSARGCEIKFFLTFRMKIFEFCCCAGNQKFKKRQTHQNTAGRKVLETLESLSPSSKKRHYWANLAGKGRDGRAQKGRGRTGVHPGASMLHYRGGGCDRGRPEKEAGTKLRLG